VKWKKQGHLGDAVDYWDLSVFLLIIFEMAEVETPKSFAISANDKPNSFVNFFLIFGLYPKAVFLWRSGKVYLHIGAAECKYHQPENIRRRFCIATPNGAIPTKSGRTKSPSKSI
jgi:hypothetical protein